MKFIYGHQRFVPDNENYKVFNFTSLGEELKDSGLIPPNNLGAINEYDFDMKYAAYILNNDAIFINFMNIICELYYGNNVYLAISDLDWSMVLVESLLKLIQQRYGINATFVQTYEDIYYVEDIQFNPYYGINNFDIDKDRYLHLYGQYKASIGAVPRYE